MSRIISWFSCGAASAVATKLAMADNLKRKKPKEFVIAYTYVANEHPDSMRFLKECEAWFGQEILILKSDKHNCDINDVFEKRKYMSGVGGAPCTMILKKDVRKDFQRFDDEHVFGFDMKEEHRIDQLIDAEPSIVILTPLIEHGYSKDMCFETITNADIELPEMYKLGYNNNNCMGCVKAQGAGYWNKIRIDFPEVFARRSKQEEIIGVSLCRLSLNVMVYNFPKHYTDIIKEELLTGRPILKQTISKKGHISVRVPLRHLPTGAGEHKDLEVGSCGFLCELVDK